MGEYEIMLKSFIMGFYNNLMEELGNLGEYQKPKRKLVEYLYLMLENITHPSVGGGRSPLQLSA